MRGLVLLALAGCAGGDAGPKDTGEEWVAPLGAPFVAIYANAEPGTFRSECLLEIDLKQEEEVVASSDLYAIGGEWSGVTLPGEDLYTVVATWSTCTTGPEGWGEEESNPLSGTAGDFFIFHYNGVLGAFGAAKQREDYEGGVVEVTFEEETTQADVEAIAADNGLSVEPVEGLTYRLTWEDETPVGAVLGLLSQERAYERGKPVWLRTPDWF